MARPAEKEDSAQIDNEWDIIKEEIEFRRLGLSAAAVKIYSRLTAVKDLGVG